MIEQLLGTALLCCIITAFFYCLFYKIACKSNINDFEADSLHIPQELRIRSRGTERCSASN